jgi:hypothetical protein
MTNFAAHSIRAIRAVRHRLLVQLGSWMVMLGLWWSP